MIDRGIRNATEQTVWDEICQKMIKQLARHQYREAVMTGVFSIGGVLDAFYAHSTVDQHNELSNKPIILG